MCDRVEIVELKLIVIEITTTRTFVKFHERASFRIFYTNYVHSSYIFQHFWFFNFCTCINCMCNNHRVCKRVRRISASASRILSFCSFPPSRFRPRLKLKRKMSPLPHSEVSAAAKIHSRLNGCRSTDTTGYIYRRHLSACATPLNITINFTFEGLFHARIFAVFDEKPIVSLRTYYFLASYRPLVNPNCRADRREDEDPLFYGLFQRNFDRENIVACYHVSRRSKTFPLSNFSLWYYTSNDRADRRA